MAGLDESWGGWLKENLARGCDAGELATILLTNGFSLPAIRAAMGARFPAHLFSEEFGAPLDVDYAALARVPAARLEALGAARSPHDLAQVYRLEKFLSAKECAGLLSVIDRRLRPSTLTAESDDGAFRTSSTCDLGQLKHASIRSIDVKIARALGLRLSHSEDIQAQRYEPGQEFKSHTDYFEPGSDEYWRFASARGNRTWTFMIYLDDAVEGGATAFSRIGARFSPRTGAAVAWNNLRPDGTPNPETLHCGEPVESGRKTIITKWFRERGQGPMFYGSD